MLSKVGKKMEQKMGQKITITLMLVIMIACGVTCTKTVGKANTYYLVLVRDQSGGQRAQLVSSNSSAQITVSSSCSSIVDISEANAR
jgi:hypothetical protein